MLSDTCQGHARNMDQEILSFDVLMADGSLENRMQRTRSFPDTCAFSLITALLL